jgi:hypothetical protein
VQPASCPKNRTGDLGTSGDAGLQVLTRIGRNRGYQIHQNPAKYWGASLLLAQLSNSVPCLLEYEVLFRNILQRQMMSGRSDHENQYAQGQTLSGSRIESPQSAIDPRSQYDALYDIAFFIADV